MVRQLKCLRTVILLEAYPLDVIMWRTCHFRLAPDLVPMRSLLRWARVAWAKLSRFAGVSEAGARRRNPEQSEGSLASPRNQTRPT